MSARTVTTWYAAVTGLLVAGFLLVPDLRTPVIAGTGLLGVAAVAAGVRRHRPRRSYSWWSLGAALFAMACGDTVQNLLGDRSAGQAGVADLFYLAMIPLVGIGLLGLTRSTTAARDRAGLLDFLILTTAAAFLLWVFAVGPFLASERLTAFERSMVAGYTLAVAVMLATTVRLMMVTRCRPASVLLVLGAVGMLVADISYGTGLLEGSWRGGGPTELGWLALYVTWGAAALHPSMVDLTEPVDPTPTDIGRPRLVLLGLAALLAPAVLLLQLVDGEVRDGVVITVVSGLTFVLVLNRLADAMDAHRLGLARERTLRESGAALVSAAGVDEVDRAVRTAVGRLVPPGAAHRIVFTVNHSDGVPAVTSSIWGPAAGTTQPGTAGTAARRTTLLRVATLRPALARQLAGFASAVLCPLVLDDRPTEPARVGALLVGAEDAVLAVLRDSVEALAAQAALALVRISLTREISRRDSEAYFRSLVQNATDVFMIVEPDRRIRYASPAAARVLGVEPAEGAELASVVHPDDHEAVSALLMPTRGEWIARSLRRPDGERIHLEVSCRDLRRDRAVRGLVVTIRDVTERRRLEQELTHRADHDALTGLVNRASFTEQTHVAVEASQRADRTVGVLCVDLDEFAAINDRHGHAVGDRLLVAVGDRIRETAGGDGTVARLGGDEFAVLLPAAESPEQVEQLAERLIAALGEPFVVDGEPVTGSASIGLATTADSTDAGELLRHASLALYVSKGAGKGRWCRYQEALHSAVVQRLELRTALSASVERLDRRPNGVDGPGQVPRQAVGEPARAGSGRPAPPSGFSVEYQPIVELESGATVGCEALVRWHHPARGPVPTEEFIALAEETGLIEPIGDWVLRQAVRAVGRWCADAPEGRCPYVSVNVSASQLATPGFAERIRTALRVANVPPALVMLEITESLLITDGERVFAELTELRAAGLRVAIDDFGTGFSSLSYLQQIPVDVLKIDRSFVTALAASPRQRALVEAVIRLARTLGLAVIAEGVETPGARSSLLDMGCTTGQGYLFARPLPESEMARRLRVDRAPAPAQRGADQH